MLKQFNPHQSIRMLLLHWEEEGQGPIVVEAAEQQQWWKLLLPLGPEWLQLDPWYSSNSVEVDLHGQYQ